ncbi:chitobiase/beta-hexosaminidase C-terminal domain-containing protein, partial [bacterium]
QPFFQFGPLDQGWWPDGLYMAPTDEALRYDIEVTRKLGFNMARKHVKIEPERWYYWCDKLGLLVWQDMPSGDEYIDRRDPDIKRSKESAAQFEYELKRMVEGRGNHPSIVVWVPYNEGWGQWDTPRISRLIKSWDPTRLVNPASGWTDRGSGDILDIHAYPGPAMPEPEERRAIVLGEFGGLGLPLSGHTWQDEDNWGYRNYEDQGELLQAYQDLIKKLEPYKALGLSAAVYTQTTDVEIEVNGLMTYDRAVIKMKPKEMMRINQGFLPPIIESRHNIFLESLEVKMYNVSQEGEIRYTTDGSEPTKRSSLYAEPIEISETATVKAMTFWPDGKSSSANETVVTKVSLRKDERVKGLRSGLRVFYYENDSDRYSKLPDFSQLKAVLSGVVRKCNLRFRKRQDDFGLVFKGYIRVPADGIYTFYSDSDDGSQLVVGSDLVVDNDYTHGMTEKSGEIALAAGFHPFKLTFFQGMGGKGLEVRYEGPGVEKQEIPSKAFFYKR